MAVLNRTKRTAPPDERTVAASDRTAVDEPTAPTTAVGEPAAPTAAADEPTAPTRRHRLRRNHDSATPGLGLRAASAGAGAVATIARVIRIVAWIVALIIALGIAFVLLQASPSNTIVSHIHDWASWLTTPFHNMFHLHGARGTVALNWGIALLVYLAAAWLITRILLAPSRAVRRRRAAVAA